jgi:peptidoglycan hydrolase CwlO-like protein
MGIIIASMALFVALIALWLASTNIKKIEIGNRELKAQLTSDILKARRELEKQIDGANRKINAFDGKMEGIIELQTQARDKVAAVESNVNKVSEELKKLINSIPPQFRQASGDDVKSGFG